MPANIPTGRSERSRNTRAAESSLLSPPTIVELAAEQLRSLILSGKLEPGERLVEEQLTARFGISRPPLREAMRLLQREGLVTVVARKGASVTEVSVEDAEEIVSLRGALERFAIGLGVPVTDPARLVPCEEAIAQMQKSAASGNRGAMVRHGYQFHRSIVALAGHRRLQHVYDSLQEQLLLCMAMNMSARERTLESLEEHVARHAHLLELIKEGNRAAVLKGLDAHGAHDFLTGAATLE